MWKWICINFHNQQCGREGVSLSTTSKVWTRGLSLSIVNNVNVNVNATMKKGVIPFNHKQYECESVSLSTVNNMDVRVYPCLQSTAWMWGWIPVYSQQCGNKGVSLSEVSSDTWWCFPFYYQRCGHVGCIPLHLQQCRCTGWILSTACYKDVRVYSMQLTLLAV